MEQTMDMTRLEQLGQFLRTRRERLTPEALGLPNDGKRRTPGLRRSEVAMVAKVSVDWYTWMEQGRNIQVSAQVLDSIARALQLDASERKHLYLLATRQFPADVLHTELTEVSATLQHVLDRLEYSPAIVTDARWNVVAWNLAACATVGDYRVMPESERNMVWRAFTSPYLRQLLRDKWEEHAQIRLAQFRASYGTYAGDPWWEEFIIGLSNVSSHFREWWAKHEVLPVSEGNKVYFHPEVGELTLEHITFQLSDAPGLRVMVNTPIGETEGKIKRLTENLKNISHP
ncbi:helix-turn-helix domain-containing protein [Paenibacillus sp. HJL G12]|uniref:Helix-turn-helix domain-containing protein n=1 Tax=Paenibacillus dendrobii TaxID=2691084 RepID=A0A7X3LIK2_9BACL|nr:helix-turn-helix transcriptional regulator [Paenibacillus dendrobii]MWV46237.1 helix-turn-helix domain-containing protein [Paenibacillus dendrobii]